MPSILSLPETPKKNTIEEEVKALLDSSTLPNPGSAFPYGFVNQPSAFQHSSVEGAIPSSSSPDIYGYRPTVRIESKRPNDIQKNPAFLHAAYGFKKDEIPDISKVTRKEAKLVSKKLGQWIASVNYKLSQGEGRPHVFALRTTFYGFVLSCGTSFILTKSYDLRIPKRFRFPLLFALPLLGGVFGAIATHNFCKPKIIYDLLELNSPLGFKSRQFLEEIRGGKEVTEIDAHYAQYIKDNSSAVPNIYQSPIP